MAQPTPSPRHTANHFTRTRTAAARAEATDRVKAARMVSGFSRDEHDRLDLLAMLGLPQPESDAVATDTTATGADELLARALTRYVRAVADAVGVSREGTTHEVTDTATAYLALPQRGLDRLDSDLMLVWAERHGWSISLETGPAETSVVVSRLTGDTAPSPAMVAAFVADVMACRRPGAARTNAAQVPPARETRSHLAARMSAHTHAPR
jgi:hypothetical protein